MFRCGRLQRKKDHPEACLSINNLRIERNFINFIAASTEVTFLMGVESINMSEVGTDGPEMS